MSNITLFCLNIKHCKRILNTAHKNSEPIINVGIKNACKIEVELLGDYHLNGKALNQKLFLFNIEENKIHCDEIYDKEIYFRPQNNDSKFKIKAVTIGIGFHWQQNEDQLFEGGLKLVIEHNTIWAINEIPLESYLCSVISSEMSAMNDLTLLKVHAIVSRSWLLAQIKQEKIEIQLEHKSGEHIKWYDREDHALFDVCADDHCQRYQGVTKISSENAQKAIEQTQGTVLTWSNEICDARFSKCCGGISENFENVWQAVEVPYLSKVVDAENKVALSKLNSDSFIRSNPEAFCNTSDPEILSQVLIDFDQKTTDFFRWEKYYSQKELSELIGRKSEIDFGVLIDLIPIERGPSHRIIKLKIVGSKQTIVVGKELEIRKWLSESHLYSSAFVVEKTFVKGQSVPSGFKLIGAGWGHGVGMCQIGAAVMSKKGYAVEEILQHYFKGAVVETIY